MDGPLLLGGEPPAPGFVTTEMDKQGSASGGASAPQPMAMAQVVHAPSSAQPQLSSAAQGVTNPHHHHQPECTGGEGKFAFFLLVPGLVLMIVGTSLISTVAVYPLNITGGSLILASLIYHGIYRLCLDGFSCERTGRRGCCARVVGSLLCAWSYLEWLLIIVGVIGPGDIAVKICHGLATVLGWIVGFCLLWWESEQCRQAKLKAWLDHRPIMISEASVAHLAAAAQAKGEPYFTASFIHLLGEKRVDGEVLTAVLKAEQVNGPDAGDARAFFDEMFQGLGIQHKIAAKGILREWVERGVPPQPQLTETALLGTVVSAL